MSSTKACKICANLRFSIFRGLDERQFEALSQIKTNNVVRKGQSLFHEGEAPLGVFCLSEGKIKLIKEGERGKEVLLRICARGDVLGIRSVILNQEYVASAIALEDSLVCSYEIEPFLKILRASSNMSFEVMCRLGKDLENVEARMSDLVNQDVRERLAQLLLNLSLRHGQNTDRGRLLNLALTRADIGAMIGSSPETVMRTLSEFREEGLIEVEGRRVLLRDLEAISGEVSFFDH